MTGPAPHRGREETTDPYCNGQTRNNKPLGYSFSPVSVWPFWNPGVDWRGRERSRFAQPSSGQGRHFAPDHLWATVNNEGLDFSKAGSVAGLRRGRGRELQAGINGLGVDSGVGGLVGWNSRACI